MEIELTQVAPYPPPKKGKNEKSAWDLFSLNSLPSFLKIP